MCLYVYVSTCLYVFLFICLYAYMPICLCVYMSIYMFIFRTRATWSQRARYGAARTVRRPGKRLVGLGAAVVGHALCRRPARRRRHGSLRGCCPTRPRAMSRSSTGCWSWPTRKARAGCRCARASAGRPRRRNGIRRTSASMRKNKLPIVPRGS